MANNLKEILGLVKEDDTLKKTPLVDFLEIMSEEKFEEISKHPIDHLKEKEIGILNNLEKTLITLFIRTIKEAKEQSEKLDYYSDNCEETLWLVSLKERCAQAIQALCWVEIEMRLKDRRKEGCLGVRKGDKIVSYIEHKKTIEIPLEKILSDLFSQVFYENQTQNPDKDNLYPGRENFFN